MPGDDAHPSSSHGPESYEPKSVNLEPPDAAAYWARRFQVPVERLHEAVRAAGHEPAQVAAHLGLPWPYEASGIV